MREGLFKVAIAPEAGFADAIHNAWRLADEASGNPFTLRPRMRF